jgi:RHS repeat-associated protein
MTPNNRMPFLRICCACGIGVGALLSGIPVQAASGGWTTATLYVSRHFEVRDRDQPVKYVFNGSTRVARVTGSLAARQRVQRLRVRSGWNLLSLAVSATNAFSQITNSLSWGSSSPAIFRWDETTPGWSPLSFGQALPVGAILWLRASVDSSLTLVGPYEEPTNRAVNPNGAYLPSAGLEAWDLASALSNEPSASAWDFDASSGSWLPWLAPALTKPAAASGVIPPGSAAFVRTTKLLEIPAPEPELRIRYYHQDHLGSSSAVTDAHGVLIEESTFHPFGHPRLQYRPRTLQNPYLFTQKERDLENGLFYFEARYLAASAARFISADGRYANLDGLPPGELRAVVSAPQQLNLYAYVQNNPVNTTDPTGLEPRPVISTPLVGEGRTFQQRRDKSVDVTLKNGVKVRILPDKYDLPADQDAYTDPKIVPSTRAISPRTTAITYTITIQTHYPRGSDPSQDSKYGRGTTDKDIADKNTSWGFHEGQHGARVLEYLEAHPLPKLNPEGKPHTADWTWADAANQWNTAMDAYDEALGDYHIRSTDCVGHESTFICK